MHLADFKIGSLGETSIVGSGIPVAVGAALGSKMMGTDRVCLCFFGDGAANEGAFHEGLNLAAIWKLPAIFLCENNLYAATTPAALTIGVKDIATRAQAYEMPGVIADGQDAVAVFAAVREAVKRARAGLGPSLIEAKTYRYLEHAVGTPFANCRLRDQRWHSGRQSGGLCGDPERMMTVSWVYPHLEADTKLMILRDHARFFSLCFDRTLA
jgi:TPP-dependent pyruvate/acetoin dehydrogenase alpha subunit